MSDPVRDNLGYFFRDSVLARPEATAIIDLWGGTERRLTYRELDARIEQAAALLQSMGLQPGDRLALLIGNRVEYLELFLGAMRAGVVPVPLNIRQTPETIEFMVRDAGSVAAAVDQEAVRDAIPIVERIGLPHRLTLGAQRAGWLSYEAARAAAPAACKPAPSPDGIAFQPYTAGSTGRPKGVRLTHAGMLWSIRSTQAHWPTEPTDIGLVAVPLFHKNAMRGMVKPSLVAGGTCVLMPEFEPRAFLQALAHYRVTFSGGVPAIFTPLLEHRDLLERLDFSSLHLLAIGSAVVPQEMIDALERSFPNLKVKESYGLTDAGGPLRAPVDGRPVPRGSCGAVTEGYEGKLVGPDGREDVSEGELWTRSPTVTAGYHNLPGLTRDKIVDGWLKTGDVFRRDADGFYYFLGRTDDMFSCGGENIYPKEVENLVFTHPAVRDVCVAPVPHRVKGFAPAAAVVLRDGATASADEIKAFCLKHGPLYAHPRRVVIVAELPLSGAGKLDRKAVQRMLEEAGGAVSE